MKSCKKCGAKIKKNCNYCPVCGADMTDEINTSTYKISKKKIIAIVAVICIAIIGVLVIVNSIPNKMSRAYATCTTKYSTISDDEKSIYIDSKPNDETDIDNMLALDDVVAVDGYLNLPDSLETKMEATCEADGKCDAEYNGIDITWHYSTDTGLEVIYTMK